MFGGEEPEYVDFDVDPAATSGSFYKPTEEDISGFTRERCGTAYWMSPAQQAGTPYSYDADIWGLGLLLFKMSTGRLPFGDQANDLFELQTAYARDPIEFQDTDGLDEALKTLLEGMLAKDGSDRLNILQVKQHDYFAGV